MPSTGSHGNASDEIIGSLSFTKVLGCVERTLPYPGPTIFEDHLLLRPNVLEIPQQTTGLSTAGGHTQLLIDGEASVVTVQNLGKTVCQDALEFD